MVRPLPQITDGPPKEERKERADAARNRAKVLEAADRLFARRGIAAVTMDDVAAEAQVGKGTLYRRFGDKSGLAAALLDERETELQRRILTGPPPLGPGPLEPGAESPRPGTERRERVEPRGGVEPRERLAAFVTSYLDYVAKHLDLVKMSQTASPGARLRTGSHQLWQHHCRILLTEAGADDPEVRADTLMAAMTAEQVGYWLERKPLTEVKQAVTRMAEALAHGRPRRGSTPGPSTGA